MADLRCGDGSLLGVHPEPVADRDGAAYEITLRLTRNSVPFGAVGERCGYFLASTAGRLAAARFDGSPVAARWPDLDDRFPASSLEAGLRAWAADAELDPDEAWETVARYLPRDRDLFAFRSRDPDDIASSGELRCSLHGLRSWLPGGGEAGAGGRWRLSQRAVLDAWGPAGGGVRSVLTSGELAAFLADLLADCAAVGAVYAGGEDGVGQGRIASRP